MDSRMTEIQSASGILMKPHGKVLLELCIWRSCSVGSSSHTVYIETL